MFPNQNLAVSSSQTWNSGTRQPGPPVVTHHVHRITSRRSSSIPRATRHGGFCKGQKGTVDIHLVAFGLDSRHDHISPASCGLWSPRLMSVKQCQDVSRLPLVEFHQRLKDTACSEQLHFFARNMIHNFPTCSFFVRLVPRSVFQLQAFCQPTWPDPQSFQPPLQELHGPDAKETRASRNNLQRFQAGRESLQYRYHNF